MVVKLGRPCFCDKFVSGKPWGEQPEGSCKKCFLFHTRQQVRKAWTVTERTVTKTPYSTVRPECIHTGKPSAPPPGKDVRKRYFECEAGKGIVCACNCNKCDSYESTGRIELGQVSQSDDSEPKTDQDWQRSAQRFLANLPTLDKELSGNGVIYVGGGRYSAGIYLGIRMLRESGCTLPVQVWHRGEAEPLPDAIRKLPGVTVIDAENHPDRAEWETVLEGWPMKSIAALHSGFAKLLYMDADAYVLADPSDMIFETDTAALWPDIPSTDNVLQYHRFGVSRPAGNVPVNGGHWIVDVAKCWMALNLYRFFDRNKHHYYKLGYGDQSCMQAAFVLTGTPFQMPGFGGQPRPQFIRGCFVQADFHRQKAFVHRIHGKPAVGREFGSRGMTRRNDLPMENEVWAIMSEYKTAMGILPIPPKPRKERPKKIPSEVFSEVYATGAWGKPWSSGVGSTMKESKVYLEIVSAWINSKGFKKILDIGSGDGRVIAALASMCPGVEFTASDCFPEIIERGKLRFPGEWIELDAINGQIPEGFDAVIVRDVLMHWPNLEAHAFLEKLKAYGKPSIVSNDYDNARDGQDCDMGKYRPIDFSRNEWAHHGLVKIRRYLHKCIWSINS